MSIFKGRTAVLATMHGKEKVIAPILERELGIKIILPNDFNSDQFGTFTRDIKRVDNQFETARNKVLKAMKIMGSDIGIASEGSFGIDPLVPFIQSNFELVLLVDTQNNIEIQGHHRSFDTNMNGCYISNVDEALHFARKVGFPEHGVIVRKTAKSKGDIYKNINSESELIHRVSRLLDGFFTKKIYIETDMRAHMNPTRMDKIAKATEDLVQNIQSICPNCMTPGFVISEVKRGLMCGMCKSRTDSPFAYMKKCQKCAFEKEVPVDKEFEDPRMCQICNP